MWEVRRWGEGRGGELRGGEAELCLRPAASTTSDWPKMHWILTKITLKYTLLGWHECIWELPEETKRMANGHESISVRAISVVIKVYLNLPWPLKLLEAVVFRRFFLHISGNTNRKKTNKKGANVTYLALGMPDPWCTTTFSPQPSVSLRSSTILD